MKNWILVLHSLVLAYGTYNLNCTALKLYGKPCIYLLYKVHVLRRSEVQLDTDRIKTAL